MKSQLQHLPGGIVNPEAYCELCQKEFCNKYFLKRHKAKMHGIVPPEGSVPPPPAPAGYSLPSSSGGSHKKSKSHSSKQTAPPAPPTAVDLIKIPLTLPPTTGPVTSPARNLSMTGNETVVEHPQQQPVAEPVRESTTPTTSSNFNLLMQGSSLGGVINNETGGSGNVGVLPSSGSSKLDLSSSSSSSNRQDNNSLSLLKIPTPSLSAMFSTPPSMMMESHPVRIHHSKTPSSSSSSGGGNGSSGGGGMVPQQLFSPERLRQMGVINTEAFCEICCKEFCNKYFLRTHKFKKHGIGSMPEQQPQQSQQQSSSHPSESSSSTGMIRQHHYNNNNNNNGANKRGGSSPKQQPNASESSLSPEQKMPLNLVSTPPGTLTTTTSTTTTLMGQQQMDSGMSLSCDLCQRPFQSSYLLHMHRTYFHNQPPPADESMNENDMNDTSAMDEDNPSDNGQEDDETGTFTNNSPRSPSIAVKSEPEMRNADVNEDQRPVSTDANNSPSGGITISADLQKLQSMIMELNGSSTAAAAAAAAASMTGEDRRRCWMDAPIKNANNSNNINQLSLGNNESANHCISASGIPVSSRSSIQPLAIHLIWPIWLHLQVFFTCALIKIF
jgi:hypothetical protein